jgi:threonine dehydratase
VSDAALIRAVKWLYGHARLVVEPSGAATTAALMEGVGHVDRSRGPVVAIVSGGNVEPGQYAHYITAV